MKESQSIEWKETWRDEYLKWICGFEKIAHECQQHGIQPPIYDSGMSGLMLSFHASKSYLALINSETADPVTGKETIQKTGVKTGVKTPVKILQLFKKNPEMTLAQVASEIGKSLSAVELASSKLVKAGRLRHVGPQKGGHWEVKKDEP